MPEITTDYMNDILKNILQEYNSCEIVKEYNLEESIHLDLGLEIKINNAKLSLQSTENKIANLSQKTIFPLEQDKYKNTLASLNTDKTNLKRDIDTYNLLKIYPEIDLSFLKMKNSQSTVMVKNIWNYTPDIKTNISLPLFAVYSLEKDNFTIHSPLNVGYAADNINRELFVSGVIEVKDNKLPSIIAEMYKDETQIKDTGYHDIDGNPRFTTKFYGFIPDDVKKNIIEAQKVFGDDIYIITEAKDWEFVLDKEKPKRQYKTRDPLVIGINRIVEDEKRINSPSDKAFFIASFNCTPSEEYIENAFVGKKQLQN